MGSLVAQRQAVTAVVATGAVIACVLAGIGLSARELGARHDSTSTRAALPLERSGSPFIRTCGMGFCLRNARFAIKGATAYGLYGDPEAVIASAKGGRLNTLELVEFDVLHHQLSDTMSAATWHRVDVLVAAARAAKLHVILNLSEFGQSLQAAGSTMSSSTWQSQWNDYLAFIANRVNSVTGIRYKNDPTIAMVEIWAEIPAPGYKNAVGTTKQLEAFYAQTLSAWKALAPNILVSSGGFSYLNDPRSGIPWQAVMRNPDNAACAMEINSLKDRNVTTGMVTAYCRALGKPWFLSAWSSCNRSNGQELRDWYDGGPITDAKMAAHAKDMYRIAKGGQPGAYKAVGTDFWNLGPDMTETCELGPQFPLTWRAIQTS